MRRTRIDITGQKFNRLTVLGYANARWVCQCDCGKEVLAKSGALQTGKTKSCGCWSRDRIAALNRQDRYGGLCECGDHAFTILTQGYVGLISPQDAHLFVNASWCAHQSTTGGWAVVGTYARKLHRVILGLDDPEQVVDHRDGNPFDNRRPNIRVCSQGDNTCNQRAQRVGKKALSRFKGVTWSDRSEISPWRAQIRAKKVSYYLGSFATEEDAARAYDAAAIRLHGEFARTNAALGLL